MTETNAAGAVISGDDYLNRPGSTGKPTPPLTKIKIVDSNHKECNENEVGEVWIKSITNFSKYWNCLLYTSPSPRDATLSRMPSSA